MSQKVGLRISFSSPDPMELMKAICRSLKPFDRRLPTIVTDAYDEYTETQDWIDKLLPTYKFSAMAFWGYGYIGEYEEGWITYEVSEKIVKIKISDYELINPESVMKMLAHLPWTVAAFSRLSLEGGWKEYPAANLDSFHFTHG